MIYDNVYQNTVYLTDPEYSLTGIDFSYCAPNLDPNYVTLTDHENYVYSAGPTRYNYIPLPDIANYPIGIKYLGADYAVHQCNATQDIYTGMWLVGSNPNTTIQGNQFNPNASALSGSARMHSGLLIDATCTNLQPQNNAGNTWFGDGGGDAYSATDPTYSSLAAANFNTLQVIQREEFGIDPTYTPGTDGNQYWPLQVTSGWFEPVGAGNYACPSPDPLTGTTVNGPCTNCLTLTPTDKAVINGEMEYNTYGDEMQYGNEQAVYEKIQMNPSLLDSAANADSFYVAKQSSAMGSLMEAENAKQSAIQPDSITWAAINAPSTIVDSLNQLLITYEDYRTITDSVYIEEIIEISGYTPQYYWGLQMQTLQTQIDSVAPLSTGNMNAYKAVKDSMIRGVLTTNASITPTNTIETNQVLLNDIYLSTVALDSVAFDSTRLAQLNYLAWQCPYSGGDAVYAARGLLALLMDTIYIDELLCDTSSERSLKVHQPDTIQQLLVKMFPNPTKDYTILQLNTSSTDEMQLDITDALGRKVFDQSIGFINTQYTINTSLLSSGLYYVNLYNNGGKLFGGKLNVLTK